MPRDLAEYICCYIITNIRKPDKILVTQFGARVLKLTEYLTLLPCHKDKEGSSKQMEQVKYKLTEMDMCIVIFSGLSQDLATKYWAAEGTHYPLCVKTLLVDLIPMELAANATNARIKKIMTKAAGRALIKNATELRNIPPPRTSVGTRPPST